MILACLRFPARAAGLFGLVLLSACVTPINPPFYQEYRDRYAITPEEFKTLQFFISGDVLAHAMDGSPGVAPEQVIIVPSRTPGLVREAGPNWLRVAFREGGEGVLFRLRDNYPNAVYALATLTEGGKIVLVSELPNPVLSQGGRRYAIVQGAKAHLIVSAEDLSRLIEKRPHAAGLKRE